MHMKICMSNDIGEYQSLSQYICNKIYKIKFYATIISNHFNSNVVPKLFSKQAFSCT